MYSYHPKLVLNMTKQTPRAMIALTIVALVYIWVFLEFVPLNFLLIWLFFQLLLAAARLYNATTLNIYEKSQDTVKIRQHIIYFLILNILQASMWTIASIFCVIYAPPPYELITFVMIIGIITAAVLSMSSIFIAYLVFFFSMIIPQMIIMGYYGEHQHIALIIFSLIYIPAIVLLSKSMYDSHKNTIKINESLKRNVYKLHTLSIMDSLTNIYNRRYFFEMAQNLISISLREEKVVSLLMLDIDFFKQINDNYGHQAGDFILENLAKEVKGLMRESDIFARVGGEEFAILLNNTSLKGAKVIAEIIRNKIEKKDFTFNGTSIEVRVSLGVAVIDESHLTIEALYTKADNQLYQAKSEGRNRVC